MPYIYSKSLRATKVAKTVVAFPHRASEHGGPGTFQDIGISLIIEVMIHILVLKDSRHYLCSGILLWLFYCRLFGAKIIHRLDGLNWRHKHIRSFC